MKRRNEEERISIMKNGSKFSAATTKLPHMAFAYDQSISKVFSRSKSLMLQIAASNSIKF